MSDLRGDGHYWVAFVHTIGGTAPTGTIADIDAPTIDEVTGAGAVYLGGRITPTGLKVGAETANVDTSKLDADTDTMTMGRRTYSPSIEVILGSPGSVDEEFEEFLQCYNEGFLVVRRKFHRSVELAAGQKVEVYPIILGEPSYVDPDKNTIQRVNVPFGITDAGNVRAFSNLATLAA